MVHRSKTPAAADQAEVVVVRAVPALRHRVQLAHRARAVHPRLPVRAQVAHRVLAQVAPGAEGPR